MANPIHLPPGYGWRGPSPWKLGLGVVLLGALVLGVLYVGQTEHLIHWFWGERKAKPTRTGREGPLEPDALLPASAKNGAAPGAPVDQAVLKREEAYRKALERAEALNAKYAEKLEALTARLDRKDAKPSQTAAGQRSAPKEDPAEAAQKKAEAKWRVATGVIFRTPLPDVAREDLRTIQRGWMIPFVVQPRLNSSVPGPFVMRVSEAVRDSATGGDILIPQGAIINGDSQSETLIAGNVRLPTVSLSLELANGDSVDLGTFPVMDAQGQNGLADEVDTHLIRNAFGWIVGGFVRGATRELQTATNTVPGGDIAAGIGQETSRGSRPMIQTLYDVRPTVIAYPGGRGVVYVAKPIKLPPYQTLTRHP